MQKQIKYVGFYDINENNKENRGYSLAATNKMDYICSALNKIGYKVIIVSPSRTNNKSFYRGKKIKINDYTYLKLFPTFPWGNIFQKAFSLFAGNMFLFIYLLMNVKKCEEILVYHSLGLQNAVRLAKKIKGFNIILEVEEIYQDVMSYSSHIKKSEYKIFSKADKFIFPTELLNEKLNLTNKPSTIIYGTYQLEEDRNSKFNDGKIHVIYAGTLNAAKGGAIAATAAAAYLSENYRMHIIGFGSENEIENLVKKIEEISTNTKCTISYDGLLRGQQYIEFLQKCDIGLSTQFPNSTYSNTSFPSKILSYMANGLRVVSVRISALEKSKIGDTIIYFDNYNPAEIAKTIMSVRFSETYDSRKKIKELDQKFMRDIEDLINH
ncbi:glycosyltransferase [Paenibacillus cremeus]|uniref:Glycosyltransferase family 4 protein n=1 Tax=Paenibacillus cremeus TaxID=2163881 RepID=A0A559K506_9BACL|nr:glycosyltransferase [Paenibacillus cremeus]TVY07214.1 glycosyltransferase family 4 protein [Paenibacillus cremeus]